MGETSRACGLVRAPSEVEDVEQMFDKWEVVELAADPSYWESEVKTEWPTRCPTGWSSTP